MPRFPLTRTPSQASMLARCHFHPGHEEKAQIKPRSLRRTKVPPA